MIRQPLLFTPVLKRIRWGGRRLNDVLHKAIGPESDYAESWEIADHREGQSIVARGAFRGRTLADLVRHEGSALFGSASRPGPRQFPLLVKFLDACDRLSVQVHPNDVQAPRYAAHENGKTEAWVIVDALPGSRVYAGLKRHVDRATLETALHAGCIESCLDSFPVTRGDCVFVPAGTVHAIGEGILLAEVQQPSNLTFRLYDWNRLGTDGRPRELHWPQALECIDFEGESVRPVTPLRVECADHVLEVLVDSPYFTLRRHSGTRLFAMPQAAHFRVLMVLEGAGRVRYGDDRQTAGTGQTMLLPADCPELTFEPDGSLTLLEAFIDPRGAQGTNF